MTFRPVSVTEHFAEGAPCVEPPAILRLYSMKFCPYAQRTRLVLAAKHIENEVVNIHLLNRPKWYYNKNPLGKVPCLELPNGKVIYESLVTCDYLDEVYPSHQLNSNDPLRKAEDRMLIELFSKVTSALFKYFYPSTPREEEATWAEPAKTVREGLQVFEKELAERATPFFGGDIKPGMLDYMIWPWFERFSAMILYAKSYSFTISFLNEAPLLTKWVSAMMEDEAVKESFISPENHLKFMKTNMAGHPDYDMEL